MRVLLVHNKYREPGGEDSVVNAEASLLEQGGHDVLIHQVDNPGSFIGAAEALVRSSWNRMAAEEVRAASREFRPDVVHVHNTWFALSAAPLWALRDGGAARVVTVHNYRLVCAGASLFRDGHRCVDCLGHLPWRGVVHRCYRGSLLASTVTATNIVVHRSLQTWETQADVIVVPSSLTRDLLVRGGLPAANLVVRPHSVPDPGPRSSAPSNSRLVLFAGRFSAAKGLLSMVKAWCASSPDDLELVLVGDGTLRSELETAGPRIRLLPWLPRADLARLMLRARALIVPTQEFETFGLTAVEAMAAGIPVVAVAGGAVAESVGDAGPPVMSSAPSSDEWHDRFSRLADGAAVDTWGAVARRQFEERYTPERGLQSLLEIYQLALDRRG